MDQVLIKPMATAISHVVGAAADPVRSMYDRTISLRKIKDGVIRPAEFLSNLNASPATANALVALFQSNEAAKIAVSIANALLLRECGGDPMNRVSDLRNTFIISANLRGGGNDCNQVAGTVFDYLLECVADQIRSQGDLGRRVITPESRAVIVKAAAHHAAAETYNGRLISSLTSISAILQFKEVLRTQIANVHAAMKLPHAGTTRQVPYDQLFVAPALRARAPSVSPAAFGSGTEAPFNRLVVLGNPGGGKSTMALKRTYDLASTSTRPDQQTIVPFLVILRDFGKNFRSSGTTITRHIESKCSKLYGIDPPPNAIDYLLHNGHASVIFDGLDELLETDGRREVVLAVEAFSYRYPHAQILVTSRHIGYEEAALDDDLFPSWYLSEFSDDQVKEYADKWFKLDESIPIERRESLISAFLADGEYVRDLRCNPLMLSLMCGLYSSESYIPRNRPDVYEKCALLLFDKWDRQRSISSDLMFSAHISSALSALALWMYSSETSQDGVAKGKIHRFLAKFLRRRRFDSQEDAEDAATSFLEFCQGRAWVLTEVGADKYAFTHRTFLEYFAATQLVRQAPTPKRLIRKLKSRIERSEWDMVAQLAVQIIGKTVDDGADDFLNELTKCPEEGERITCAVASFAARCLTFVVPRPPLLRNIVSACVDAGRSREIPQVAQTWDSQAAGHLIPVATENLALVSKYLFNSISREIEASGPYSVSLARYLWHPSMHSSSALSNEHRLFWFGQQQEYRMRLRPFMESRTDDPWVNAALYTNGWCTLDDLVKIHGVDAIYRPLVLGGRRLGFPEVATLLESAYSRDARTSDNAKTRILEVAAFLVPRKRRWFKAETVNELSIASLSGIVQRDPQIASVPEQRELRSAVAIILTPWAETQDLDTEIEVDSRSVFQLGRLRSKMASTQLIDDQVRRMDLTDVASVFLRSWGRRYFSVSG